MRRVIRIKQNNNGTQPTAIQTDKTGFYPVPVRKKLDELQATFNWIKIAPDGVLDIFCDHHILSTFRTCEYKFVEEIKNNLVTKGGNWALHFGISFHKWMEWFDEAEDKNFTGKWSTTDYLVKDDSGKVLNNEITVANWIIRCNIWWNENNLDQYKDEPGFKELEGWPGAQNLLLHYWNRYSNNNERLRTVGTEIGFGREKEVPLLTNPTQYWYAPFRCYLTGRIDRIIDNGRVIGVMDRKTHRYFKKGLSAKYKPHDAFLGYIYAINKIMGARFYKEGKACNSIFIDLISLNDPGPKTKIKERFIRAIRDWGQNEMDDFVTRQISTFSSVYQLLVLDKPPQWNTMACHNQYFKDCPYKILHEVGPESRLKVIQGFFKERDERWSPYKKEEEQENQVLAEE